MYKDNVNNDIKVVVTAILYASMTSFAKRAHTHTHTKAHTIRCTGKGCQPNVFSIKKVIGLII